MRYVKILFLMLLISLPIYAAKIKTGEQLIGAMHKKYAGKWYKTLTFVQKNTIYKPDGTTENSVWYEAMSGPGKLRIHTGKKMRERIPAWRHRGLFVFYLPTYSPHLNIAETLWRAPQIRMVVSRRLQVERTFAIRR